MITALSRTLCAIGPKSPNSVIKEALADICCRKSTGMKECNQGNPDGLAQACQQVRTTRGAGGSLRPTGQGRGGEAQRRASWVLASSDISDPSSPALSVWGARGSIPPSYFQDLDFGYICPCLLSLCLLRTWSLPVVGSSHLPSSLGRNAAGNSMLAVFRLGRGRVAGTVTLVPRGVLRKRVAS